MADKTPVRTSISLASRDVLRARIEERINNSAEKVPGTFVLDGVLEEMKYLVLSLHYC